MDRIFSHVLFLVIGLSVGASVGMFLFAPQVQRLGTEQKVTLIDIECERFSSDYAVIRLILKNTFTNKILSGNVTIFQDGGRWTSEVDWRVDWRNGYGFAEIKCRSLDENQNFRIEYTENYPSKTYLEEVIEWDAVRVSDARAHTQTTTAGKMIKYDSAVIDATSDMVTVYVRNWGTEQVILDTVFIDGDDYTQSVDSPTGFPTAGCSLPKEDVVKITLNGTQTGLDFNAGSTYKVKVTGPGVSWLESVEAT